MFNQSSKMSSLSRLTDEADVNESDGPTMPPPPPPPPASAASETINISFLAKCWNGVKHCAGLLYITFGIYFLWICIHYFAVQLYVYYCVQPTVYGFFISPFLASALHCKALNWSIYNSSNIIEHMWVLLSTWICAKLFINVTTNNL